MSGFALPTRRTDGASLARRARQLAAALAARLSDPAAPGDEGGAGDPKGAGPPPGGPMLAQAQALFAQGAIDRAAESFDAALEAAARTPHQVADPAALVTGHIQRAQIALARGEGKRAAELLERLLRYDPTFRLRVTEDSPRMRSALEGARQRLGSRAAVRPQELGSACAGGGTVIVARAGDEEAAEFLRFDDCHFVVATLVGAGSSDQGALALLSEGLLNPVAPSPQVAVTAPTPVPLAAEAQPRPATHEPAPRAENAENAENADRPFYRKPWFWVAVGAAAAGAAVGIWAAESQGSDMGQFKAVPRF